MTLPELSADQIALIGAYGQAGAAVIAVPALIALLLQLRAMRHQLDEDRQANRASASRQAEFFVVEYLERSDNLELRKVKELKNTPRERWTPAMAEQANLLSGMWEVVAALVDAKIVPKHFVRSLYGGAMARHWIIVRDHVYEMRRYLDEPQQRHNFEGLALEFGARGTA